MSNWRWVRHSTISWRILRPYPFLPGRSFLCPDAQRKCEEELRSTLEDGVLAGLRLCHHLPVIGSIDLNKEPTCEPVDSL